jgi:hypothetical protein
LPVVLPAPGVGRTSRTDRRLADVGAGVATHFPGEPELRNAVGLEKEVMMLGMGTHFEIWDAAKLAENEAEAVAGGMPDVLSNFSF